MSTKKNVNIGIIGGGLMGRELASALARWFVFVDPPVEARLVAVADLSEQRASGFDGYLPSLKLLLRPAN